MSAAGKRIEANQSRIVSANLLLEGDVVYRTHAGGWSSRLSDAAIVSDDAEADALLAAAEAEPHLVVDAALAAVAVDAEGRVAPLAHRERIRALGPSNRPDLGKQAENDGAASAEAA